MDSQDLTYTKLFDLVEDNDLLASIDIIINNSLEKPWLVNSLMYGLSDSNRNLTSYSMNVILNMCNTVVEYYEASWSSFFDISSGAVKLEKLLDYTKQSRYYIDAAFGRRIATVKEVEEGTVVRINNLIVGLEDYPTISLSEDELSFINLYTWTVTGLWRYYKRAGFELKYKANGELDEPEIRYIMRVQKAIEDLCVKLKNGYYESVIEKMKHIKKLGVYKYPEYASDEITIDGGESIQYVINQLEKGMPKYKTDNQKKSYSILHNKNKMQSRTRLSTEDKITLRKAYLEMVNPSNESVEKNKEDNDRKAEIKDLCDKIRKGVADGHLSTSEFAVKVVGTISKTNYSRMSDKQRAIIIEAINKIELNKNSNSEKEKLNDIVKDSNMPSADDFGLASLSNMLGSGDLFNES